MRGWLGVMVLLHAAVSHADPDPEGAKVAAKEAEKLAAAKDYVAAAAKFRIAARLDPQPQYVCNVGVSYQRARQLPRAQLYLGECLRRGSTLDATFIGLVRDALGTVEAKLRAGAFGPVDIVVVPDGAVVSLSAFDADESFVGSRVVWLPWGTHTVEVTAEGYRRQRRTLEVRTRGQQQQRFELTRETSAEPASSGADARGRSNVLPLAATAGTVAIGTTALLVFVHAHSLMQGAASTTIDRAEYDRRIGDARTWQHASWALTGLAGAGAIISALLWVRASQSATIEVAPGGDGAEISLVGTW
jgi:hypothetical protein